VPEHASDPAITTAVAAAEARFPSSVEGAIARGASGPHGDVGKIVGEFDPKAEQVQFIPQLQGG
jgi:hypothetical protein